MAPKTRSAARADREEANGGARLLAREETIEVEHNKSGIPFTIVALRTSGDRDPNLNWITKACASALGFSANATKIRLVWSIPLDDVGGTYDDDDFLVINTASHGIIFGESVSERILEAKKERPALAVHARWARRHTANSHSPFALASL